MSTNSQIAILKKDGTVRSHYNQSGGYLYDVGTKLYLHYSSVKKVNQLIDLGDTSHVEKEIEPPLGQIHNFDKPYPGVTVAYCRDRNETKSSTKSIEFENLDEYLNRGYSDSYNYIFDEKKAKWFFFARDQKILVSLEKTLFSEMHTFPPNIQNSLLMKKKFIQTQKENKILLKDIEQKSLRKSSIKTL